MPWVYWTHRIWAGGRLQSSSLQSTRCEQAEYTADLPGIAGLGGRTQTPRDLKWQVIPVLITSLQHPCWQQIQGQHISSDTDDTKPEIWEIFHRRQFSFFRSNLWTYQFSHTTVSLAHLFNFPFKNSKQMTLRGLRNGNNLCLSLQISYPGYKIILNVYVNV